MRHVALFMRSYRWPILQALTIACYSMLAPAPVLAQIVPPGFKCELLFQPPEIEHPSAVTCDDDGNLFVGEDPMDMQGPTTKEIDRVILFRWDKKTGRPIRTVFCDHLSAVFGLIWHDGALYVLHAPHYTMFKSTKGDGVADVRKELADGFGPPPGIYGFNDHIVTGTKLGMDGRVYVSVGDKGIPKATGSDGSTITMEGGGVVRMTLDGKQLEIYSTGTRNHLDPAMDELDHVFTYDNTDDGLGWNTRFSYHLETGYYGYPYDYHPHPERHLPALADHGGGAPTGAAFYREAAWPEKYRNTDFSCEWGKGKVQQFTVSKKGASFESRMVDFMTSDGSGDLRPVDLDFSPDGKFMYVADWNYSGWCNPDIRGRLFRITYTGNDAPAEPPRGRNSDPIELQIRSLGHPARSERMRAEFHLAEMGKPAAEAVSALLARRDAPNLAKIHAIWTQNLLIDRLNPPRPAGTPSCSRKDVSSDYVVWLQREPPLEPGTLSEYDPMAGWVSALLHDSDADVRAQAARALGLRRIHVAVVPLTTALRDSDAAVRAQAAIALGRIGDAAAAKALFDSLADKDQFARFAVMQALRTLNDWKPAAEFVRSGIAAIRTAAVLTLTDVYDSEAVKALCQAAANETYPDAQIAALEALGEVCREAEHYKGGWWSTQPARGKPARLKTHDWAGTAAVLAALHKGLSDTRAAVRRAAVAALQDSGDPALPREMRKLLATDPDDEVRRAAVAVLAAVKDSGAVADLAAIATDSVHSEMLRKDAVRAIAAIGSPTALGQLAALVADDKSSPELVIVGLQTLGDLKNRSGLRAIEKRLTNDRPTVRAAAATALGSVGGQDAVPRLIKILDDPEALVRVAALQALSLLRAASAVPAMVAAAGHPDVRFEAMQALAAMPDRQALPIYLQGIVEKNQSLREASLKALIVLRNEIGRDIVELHKRNELSPAVRAALQSVFASPAPIMRWRAVGPWTKPAQPSFDPGKPPDQKQTYAVDGKTLAWKELTTHDERGMFKGDHLYSNNANTWALCYTNIESDTGGAAQLILGSDDQAVVYVNGKRVYEYLEKRGWQPDAAKVDVELKPGANHVYFLAGNSGGAWEWSLAVSRREPKFAFLYENVPAKLDTSVYWSYGVKHDGNATHGQKLFADVKGVSCIKCHCVAGVGGKIGPDLQGIGAKYPREELIRSVLEPSARIAEGFQVTIVATDSGRVYNGIVKSDTQESLDLIDADGKLAHIPVKEIETRTKSNISLMPNGLKDGMTLDDFADIIAYLQSLKNLSAAQQK